MAGRTPTVDDDSTPTDAVALRRLHRATREMVTHERPAAIAAVATDTAADVLGFALNSVRAYDEETERLVPLAAADRTVDLAGERRPYERGETVQWAALDDDEPKLYPDAAAIDDDVSRPGGGSVLVVPLGEAGVLTLGTTERDGIDQTDVELARVLAANVQTAFERAERVRLLRRREERLAAKTERLDRFGSLVAHEFRNPLAIAAGHLELTAPADETDRDHLRAAREAVDRMERLTESILDLTNHRGLTDATESVAVGYVARSVWADHAPAAATLDCESPPTVEADRQRLRTLFENLFDNAVGIGGPSVSVTVRERADGPGFVVTDDGPGFDAADPTELFAYGATVEAAGTGLGLALVRDIAEAHGWAVDVDGEDGGTFVFRTEPEPDEGDADAVDARSLGDYPIGDYSLDTNDTDSGECRRHPTDT